MDPGPRTTITVNESALRLAESIAERYGVTLDQFFDMLLLEIVHRVDRLPPSDRPPAPVIDLASRRRQRRSA